MQVPQPFQVLRKLSNGTYPAALTVIFLSVGGLLAAHHEMWRDEIQAWLLARDSTSVIDLFRNLKYEGHPGLWHLCLMPLSRITASPVIMQVFHLMLAATTVYVVTRFSPFSRMQKFLFAFGYFALYEYAVVCRNYAPGLLLLCLFCAHFQHRYAKFLRVGVILLLLAHTSAHALILTIVIGGALFLDYLVVGRKVQRQVGWNEREIWIGFALIAFGIMTAVIQLKPPADTGFAVGWFWRYDPNRLQSAVKLITNAYLPVPEGKLHFWGSNVLGTYPFFRRYQLPLCYLLIGWFSLAMLRRPTALLMYLGGTFGLLSFFYVKYPGSIRHHGFLFLLLMTVCWIYRYCPTLEYRPVGWLGSLWEKSIRPLFTLLLAFHVAGAFNAARMDYQHTFSQGKAVAAYIEAQDLADLPIVGHGDFAASTAVGYLERDKVFYPRGSRFGSFIVWDKARTADASNEQVLEAAANLNRETGQPVLLLLNYALNPQWAEAHHLTELSRFVGSTIGDESFYLYIMR